MVIIDEIEKHLHPHLQRRIIKNLVERFPKIQFIISTHSPLCVSGVSDAADGTWRIYSTHIEEGQYKISEKPLPTGLRADQILVDYFDLPTTLNITLQNKVDSLRELMMKPKLSIADKKKFDQLDEELKKEAPLLAEREEDRRSELEAKKLIENLRLQLIRDGFINDND